MSPTLLLDAVINLGVVEKLHPRDSMLPPNATGQHYSSVGRGALINILSALTCRLAYGGGETAIHSILDFGCGYGGWRGISAPPSQTRNWTSPI
jgi:hypothetical protein